MINDQRQMTNAINASIFQTDEKGFGPLYLSYLWWEISVTRKHELQTNQLTVSDKKTILCTQCVLL